jgi:hypothetical protein
MNKIVGVAFFYPVSRRKMIFQQKVKNKTKITITKFSSQSSFLTFLNIFHSLTFVEKLFHFCMQDNQLILII